MIRFDPKEFDADYLAIEVYELQREHNKVWWRGFWFGNLGQIAGQIVFFTAVWALSRFL